MKKKKRIIRPALPTIKKKVKKSSIPTAMEYLLLFNTCVINKEKIAAVDKIIDEKITQNRSRYESVSSLVRLGNSNLLSLGNKSLFASTYTPFFDRFNTNPLNLNIPSLNNTTAATATNPPYGALNFNLKPQQTAGIFGNNYFDSSSPLNGDLFGINNSFGGGASIPWYFIACVHYMECSFSFKHHLHNGDPLTGYTTHVPANRPKVGHGPPFTFEESAVDALKLMKYDKVTNWSLPFILQKLEGYNGFGYSKRGIHTPYLWSFSNQYTKGKYVKDGVFSADAVSQQMGAAVILKRMEDRAIISIPRS
jgi:lysozyme family protein